MSTAAEKEKLGDAEFRWGKKGNLGGKNRTAQFYKSFSYDDVEYFLYDCVYLHTEGQGNPYIGKLIKIWEKADKAKMVKVQWFFQPSEITYWLKHHNVDTLEKEIFFASGEGDGLANVNPLEAIAGKCNVVCTSADCRNPQPSEEQIQMADFVFYRTFDVGSCTISDIMGDKVGGLEVNFVFNRKESEMTSDPNLVSKEEEDGDRISVEKDHIGSMVNAITNKVKDSAPKVIIVHREKSDEGPLKSEDPHGMGSRPSKRAKLDTSSKFAAGNELRTSALSIAVSEDKTSGCKELVGMVKEKRYALDSSTLDENTPKKKKFQQSMEKIAPKEMPIEKEKVVKNSTRLGDGPYSDNHDGKITKPITSDKCLSKEKPIYKLKGHAFEMDKSKGISEKNLDKKVHKLQSHNLANVSRAFVDADEKIEGRRFEVTRKPDAEKGKWFMSLPWEERMQSAYEKRTLILLQNLDPDYTSGEVVDIVWSAFKENCEAKVVQRTAYSSPHSGQAFVIFKTREAAERVIRKLSDGCLILPNQRPLVGRMAVLPKFTGKQSALVGHLFVDKVKLQMQKEMKDAVSTSHCSQSNTIEYELAMDWCLLQSRFDFSWEALYKRHREDLKRLMTSFKSN